MGLLRHRGPKRTTGQPSWVSPTPTGPVTFDPELRTAAELVGQPATAVAPPIAAQPEPAVSQPDHVVAA